MLEIPDSKQIALKITGSETAVKILNSMEPVASIPQLDDTLLRIHGLGLPEVESLDADAADNTAVTEMLDPDGISKSNTILDPNGHNANEGFTPVESERVIISVRLGQM